MALVPVQSKDALMRRFRAAAMNAGFSRLDPSSGLMLVAAPLVEMQAELEEKLAYQFEQTQIESALGGNLDRIAQRYGLQRMESARAHSSTFRFYTYTGGTYGSCKTVGMPDTLVIPAGTYVFNPTAPGVRFQTVYEISFSSDTVERYVTVEATGTGSAYRVDPGVLTAHSLVSAAAVIWCSNPMPIDTGDDRETDESLRYRISRRLESLGSGTTDGLKSVLVALPGVRDVQVSTNLRGPGTVMLTVLGVSNPTSPETLDLVDRTARRYVAAGVMVQVTTPRELPVSVRMVATPDDAGLRSYIKAKVATVFANLLVGQELQASDLVYAAYQAGADDASVVWMDVNGREVVGGFNQTPPSGCRFYLNSIEVETR